MHGVPTRPHRSGRGALDRRRNGVRTVFEDLLSAEALDAAGNRSAQSEQLTLTVDRTAPAAPSQPDLLAASDSGPSAIDNITNIQQPAFTGTGEANAKVYVYADGNLVGQGVVSSDLTDGVAGNRTGRWEVQVALLADGQHAMTVV